MKVVQQFRDDGDTIHFFLVHENLRNLKSDMKRYDWWFSGNSITHEIIDMPDYQTALHKWYPTDNRKLKLVSIIFKIQLNRIMFVFNYYNVDKVKHIKEMRRVDHYIEVKDSYIVKSSDTLITNLIMKKVGNSTPFSWFMFGRNIDIPYSEWISKKDPMLKYKHVMISKKFGF